MTSLEMQAFLAVQDAGSITKAAELLYISQSSLSTRLQTLEQELGCKLFVRGRGAKAMALTPEGEQFLPLARQHQALERKMSNLTQDKPEEHIIRLSSFNSIGTYLLPPILQRFPSFGRIRGCRSGTYSPLKPLTPLYGTSWIWPFPF